jgi:hypothetical protein
MPPFLSEENLAHNNNSNRCQFHQHFESSFSAYFLAPKSKTLNFKHKKTAQNTFVQK